MKKFLKAIDDIADSTRFILTNKEDDKIERIEDIVINNGGYIEEDDTLSRSCIIKKNNNKFIIKISPKLKEKQKRLWIAFELGNLFIHMGYKVHKEKFNTYKEGRIYDIEMEQNYEITLLFAIALLTPRKLFIEKMKENYEGDRIYNIKNVAEYFNVDEDVIAMRGKNLGLLVR